MSIAGFSLPITSRTGAVDQFRFMKRLLVKLIHHLEGFPVPSAYRIATNRAASSDLT